MAATESTQQQMDLPSATNPGSGSGSGSGYSDEFPSLDTSFKTTKNKNKSRKQTFTLAEFSNYNYNYKPPCSSSYKVSESCSGDRDIPRVWVSPHDTHNNMVGSGSGSDDIKFPSQDSIGTATKFGSSAFTQTHYMTSARKPQISNPAYAAAKAAEAAAAKALDAALAAYASAAAAAAAASPRPELKPETKASLDYIMKDCIRARISNDNENWNPSSPPDINDPMQLELRQKLMCEQARKALEHYEDTEGEEFELVEIKDNEAAILPPYIIDHLTFIAKPRYLSDSCPKLFFAEIYERFGHTGDYEVKICMILDPSGPDVMKGCGYVQGDEHMLHPKGVKFWSGPPSGTPEWDEENGIGSSSADAR